MKHFVLLLMLVASAAFSAPPPDEEMDEKMDKKKAVKTFLMQKFQEGEERIKTKIKEDFFAKDDYENRFDKLKSELSIEVKRDELVEKNFSFDDLIEISCEEQFIYALGKKETSEIISMCIGRGSTLEVQLYANPIESATEEIWPVETRIVGYENQEQISELEIPDAVQHLERLRILKIDGADKRRLGTVGTIGKITFPQQILANIQRLDLNHFELDEPLNLKEAFRLESLEISRIFL